MVNYNKLITFKNTNDNIFFIYNELKKFEYNFKLHLARQNLTYMQNNFNSTSVIIFCTNY